MLPSLLRMSLKLRLALLLTAVHPGLAGLPQEPLLTTPPSAHDGAAAVNARAHAPQVFNAVHSAMRQWGSSLQHNGMSFFPVTIPARTLLYHGTSTSKPVEGMEWLSFEIECAESFARSGRGGPGGGRPGRGGPGRGPPPKVARGEGVGATEEESNGFLHEYRTTRDMTRLIYIDGMAGAKSTLGPLDTQDFVLRYDTYGKEPSDGRAGGDYQRAEDICEWGSQFGIEGFIRMEPGFEVILCEFKDALEVAAVHQRPGNNQAEGQNGLERLEKVRGVALRYDGITANRAIVDFSSMFSAFFYPYNLTNPEANRSSHARLAFAKPSELLKLRTDLEITLKTQRNARESVDWQGVADMIIARYSSRLEVMAANATSQKGLRSEANFLLTHFIDYDPAGVDIHKAIEKCTTHYLTSAEPSTDADHLIYAAFHTVSQKICTNLFDIRDSVLGEESEVVTEHAKTATRELMHWLNWSSWLQCGKCAYDEVCYVAIWPGGGLEDHVRPACRKEDDLNRGGYWNPGQSGPGGPGGPRGPGRGPGN